MDEVSSSRHEQLDVGRSPRVLVVDDEAFVRRHLLRCLRAEGYWCDEAEDVDEAWEALGSRRYELLLSDINMPGGSGLELLRRVRARFGDEVAVVMVTGIDDKETGLEALESGAYSYLIKPFERNEAVLEVANALERRRLVLEDREFERTLREEVRKAQEEIAWRLLSAVGWRDEETGAHIHRVGRGSQIIAGRLGWPGEKVAAIKLAAAMHDIGKIGVPDAILLKVGSLTDAEFELVKRHTEIGANMLGGSSNPLLSMAEDIAHYHHERWDGDGYPKGLAGEEIPQSARIVSVVDVFDALISDRPYRPAFSQQEALEIMESERGKQFDPEVLDAFVKELAEIRRVDELLRCSEDPSLRFPGSRLERRAPLRVDEARR